jgi:hypothetical protein
MAFRGGLGGFWLGVDFLVSRANANGKPGIGGVERVALGPIAALEVTPAWASESSAMAARSAKPGFEGAH